MQVEFVGLPDEIDAKAAVWLFLDEHEALVKVDSPRRHERIIRPQSQPFVAGSAGKTYAGIDQSAAEVATSPVWVDEKQPQFRGCGVVLDAEDATHSSPVDLGDPRRLLQWVLGGAVVRDNPRDQRLERRFPTELGGVDLAVRHDHPAEVSRPIGRPDQRLPHVRLLKSVGPGRPDTDTTVSVIDTSDMTGAAQPRSARREELLELAYRYVLAHGLVDLSLRPLAAAIGSSPRVLLFLFKNKDGLTRALLARARTDELDLLDRARATSGDTDLAGVAALVWQWLSAKDHRPLLTLWVEGYARSLVEPNGPWADFARQTVQDWLAVLAANQAPARRRSRAGTAERTLVLAVLRGALLDLLATGDLERITAAVHQQLRQLPAGTTT